MSTHQPKTTIDEYKKEYKNKNRNADKKINPLKENLACLQNEAWTSHGSLTLWIGAGFGKLYSNLPLWSELLEELAASIDTGDDHELISDLISRGRLQVAAEVLTEINTAADLPSDIKCNRLTDFICKKFDTSKINFDNNPLYSLYPGTVITTNYDTALDRIFSDYQTIGPGDSIESIFNYRPKLVKLHGSVKNPSNLVLNVSSYAKTYNKEFEWFLAHIFQNTTVLFVGASLAESEPYMRIIRLLNKAKLLRKKHFALLPFPLIESEVETNKVIKLRAAELEKIGIYILPYFVECNEDHLFVDHLLRELRPQNPEDLVKAIISLNETLSLFGPEKVGPSIFRLFAILDQNELKKQPFFKLIRNFLQSLLANNRYDLCREWRPSIHKLVKYYETTTINQFARELEEHPNTSNKAHEIALIKAFFFDSVEISS